MSQNKIVNHNITEDNGTDEDCKTETRYFWIF